MTPIKDKTGRLLGYSPGLFEDPPERTMSKPKWYHFWRWDEHTRALCAATTGWACVGVKDLGDGNHGQVFVAAFITTVWGLSFIRRLYTGNR